MFTNRAVWIAVSVLLALQLLFVHAPFMQHWFGTATLDLRHWLLPVGIGLLVFFIIEAEKFLLRRLISN